MSIAKRRNSISGQFAARTIEMLESPAYRVMSRAGHMVISRVEVELGHHGGNDNDNLPVTKGDFVQYGIHHNAIAPAVREAEALGFLRVKRGRGGNAEHRTPSKYGLTYAHHRNSKRSPPTDEWRTIKTIEEAEQIAVAARKAKDSHAVSIGNWSAKKRKRSGTGFRQVSGTESGTENTQSPAPESGTTGSGPKPVPLSISRGGMATGADGAAEPAPLHGIGHNQGPPLDPAEQRIIEARNQRQASQARYDRLRKEQP
jgi:hypothetical protein